MNLIRPENQTLSAGEVLQIDALCDRFEKDLQSGQESCFEALLDSAPKKWRAELLRQLLLIEWEYRSLSGEVIVPVQEMTRFPGTPDAVRDAYEEFARSELAVGPNLRKTSLSEILGKIWLARGYEILGRLGQSEMSAVYLANDSGRNRLVALKTLPYGVEQAAEKLARFQTETEVLSRLDHEHIIEIYDVGEEERPYYSMEYCEGGSLADFLARERLAVDEAASLIEILAKAIEAAHKHDIVHRDLKPSNILLKRRHPPVVKPNGKADGGPPPELDQVQSEFLAKFIPKLADFGLIKPLGNDSQTRTGELLGTPQYMAPEQARGDQNQTDARADVYALGAILYECLAGRPPFVADSLVEMLTQVIHNPAPPPSRFAPKLHYDLETICLKCLKKDPTARYQSAQELASDLAKFRNRKEIEAQRDGIFRRLREWTQRNPLAASLIGVLFISGVVGFSLALWALKERGEAVSAKHLAETKTAHALYGQASVICEQSGPEVGMHWLARSLDRAIEAGDQELEQSIRLELGVWRSRLRALKHVYPHENNLYKAFFSPDGSLVLTCSLDKTARLWNTTTGKPVGTPFVHPDSVYGGAFSPDAQRVLTACRDGIARVWDVETGEQIRPELKNKNRVLGVAWSPNGRYLLTASHDKTCQLWDATTFERIGPPHQHDAVVRCVDFSPDGSKFATGDDDGNVRLFDTITNHPLTLTLQLKREVFAVDFRPDGKWLLVCCRDSTARFWNLETGESSDVILQHQNGVMGGGFGPRGRFAVTASDDRTARIWEVETGKPLGRLRHGNWVRSAKLSPDQKWILTSCFDDAARLWESALPTRLKNALPVRAAFFDPSDGTVVTCGSRGLKRWNTVKGNQIGSGREQDEWRSVGAFSPDGSTMLVAGDAGLGELIDVKTGQRISQPLKHPAWIYDIAFSLDGRLLLTTSLDEAQLWDARSGEGKAPPARHLSTVLSVAFRPDGKVFLTGCADGTVQQWDVQTRQKLGEPFRHPRGVLVTEFHPKGRLIACGGLFHEVFLWDAETGKPYGEPLQLNGHVRTLTFSPDGKVLVTGSDDYTVRFWEVATGQSLGSPWKHSGRIEEVMFSPDGRTLLTRCQDLSVRLWPYHGPVKGTPENVRLWCEVLTGMRLDEAGTVQVLSPEEWLRRRNRHDSIRASWGIGDESSVLHNGTADLRWRAVFPSSQNEVGP